MAARTLERVIDIHAVFPSSLTLRRSSIEGSFRDQTDSILGELPNLVASGDGAGVLAWCRRINQYLVPVLRMNTGDIDQHSTSDYIDAVHYFTPHLDAVMDEDQRIASAEEAERYRAVSADLLEEVQVLADEARGTASSLQDAAGMGGSASLSSHFEIYAKAEKQSANIFRGLTIGAIGIAVMCAVVLPHPASDDWPGIVYRLAVVLGIAGLGTYFGRQAGQHRRVYNWAKALQVQLQSFPAFMEAVRDEETSASIYAAFAKRVLGAPPEAGHEADSSIDANQVIELATAVAKRNA